MDQTPTVDPPRVPDFKTAWERASGQLRLQISEGSYKNWVAHLKPLDYHQNVFTLGAMNLDARDWAENHIAPDLNRLMSAIMNEPVKVRVILKSAYGDDPMQLDAEAAPESGPRGKGRSKSGSGGEDGTSQRKLNLEKAYGSEKMAIIQPERFAPVTFYFLDHWMPLLGHSAAIVIITARRRCYLNWDTGKQRNTLNTDMKSLADSAKVSVRTLKAVLNNELVKRYFLRYRVRRVMTANGVRTAGISLEVRMDEPLTPDDLKARGLRVEDEWFMGAS